MDAEKRTGEMLLRQDLRDDFVLLSTMEKQLVQLMSIYLLPTKRIDLVSMAIKWFRNADVVELNLRGKVEETYKSCRDQRFLDAGSHGVCCNKLIVEEVTQSAVLDGTFGKIAAFVQRETAHDARYWGQFGLLCQAFRIAVYSGDEIGAASIYREVLDELKHEHRYNTDPIIQILSATRDRRIWDLIPPSLAYDGLAKLYEHSQFELDGDADLVDLGLYVWPKLNSATDGRLMLLIVIESVLCGRFTDARRLAGEMAGHFALCADGMLEYFADNHEKSVQKFTEALTLYRREERRKRLYWNNFAGVVYILALLRSGRHENLLVARDLLKDADARTNKSSFQRVFRKLEKVVKWRIEPGGKRKLWEYGAPWSSWRTVDLPVFFDVMVETWIDAEGVKEHAGAVEVLEGYLEFLECTNYRLLTDEVHKVLDLICPASAPSKLDGSNLDDEIVVSMADAQVPMAKWEVALEALSRIGEGLTSDKTVVKATEREKRLSWRIRETGGSECDSWSVNPCVQTKGKKGRWTRGSSFPYKKRFESGFDREFMTDQDERACLALESDDRNTGIGYYYIFGDYREVLYELAGHPLVFWDDKQLVPAEVIETEPRLEVRKINNRFQLCVHPSSVDQDGYGVLRAGDNKILVYKFSSEQMQAKKALGEKGLQIPESSLEKLGSTLSQVSGFIDVHSDVAVGGACSTPVEPSAEMVLRLEPRSKGLILTLLVRPFGESGPSYEPARGTQHVFAVVSGEKVSTSRDLKKEKESYLELLDRLGLDPEGVTKGTRFIFEAPEDALELLSVIDPLRTEYQVEWPEGVKMRVTQRLTPDFMTYNISKKRKWLEVSGRLIVDENHVVEVAQLLEMMEKEEWGYIPLGDGLFVQLGNALRKQLERLKAIGTSNKNGVLQIGMAGASALSDVVSGSGAVEADAQWKKLDEKLRGIDTFVAEMPSTLQATLRDYQREGFHWMSRLAHLGLGACLADDMGMGKTVQALAVLLDRAGDGPALVVAPTSVCQVWMEEARRFAPALNIKRLGANGRGELVESMGKFDVLVCSYGLLQREAKALKAHRWTTVVLDEAQFIKNRSSERARAAFGLRADFKIVTTGTPVENRLAELWSIFNFLNPGLLGSYPGFFRSFESPIQKDGHSGLLATLKWIVSPFILRRTKSELLEELPERTEITRYAIFGKKEAAFYELQRRQAESLVKAVDPINAPIAIITMLTRLRQACCHPRLLEPDADIPSAKLEILKEIVSELKAGGHKALVFSQFVKYLSIVREWLDDQGIAYQYLDGATPASKRVQVVDDFQSGKGDVFLISIKAGGFGLNLTAADYVIHLDPWWNPAVEDQASDRAYRIGQIRPVTVYRIVAANTVEEKILHLHGEKRALAQGILQGADKVGGMNAAQLFELLRDVIRSS